MRGVSVAALGVLVAVARCGDTAKPPDPVQPAVAPAAPPALAPLRLDVPDAAFIRDRLPPGHDPYFGTELSVTATTEMTSFHVRFSRSLMAATPPPPRQRGLRDLGLSLLLDVDGDPSTGVALDRFFASADGWEDDARNVNGFGVERTLTLAGTRRREDPRGPWTLDVRLSRFEPRLLLDADTAITVEERRKYPRRPVEGVNLTSGPVLARLNETDPLLQLEADMLTVTFPSALTGMAAGRPFKVKVDGNGGFGPPARVVTGLVTPGR